MSTCFDARNLVGLTVSDVCVPSRLKYKVLCVLQYIWVNVIYCHFTGIFYAVVRQISLLFIDNKDSVF